MKNTKDNILEDIRKFSIPSVRLIESELGGISQTLARASDRIEKLENAIKEIKKYNVGDGRHIPLIDEE